jgi:hypothetical protein
MDYESMSEEGKKAFALAEGLFSGCVAVGKFISSTVRAAVDPVVKPGSPGEILWAQSLRIDAWLRSLERLNAPSDFQAVSAGCRAILESSIDIVFVSHRPQDHERIRAWEESYLLKQAQAIERYCARDPEEAKLHQWPLQFAQREKARITGLRQKYGWVDKNGKPIHPNRWTKRDLGSDSREADKLQKEFEFEKFYDLRYSELCWTTHGSGFVVRAVGGESVPILGARAYREIGYMTMLSAQLVLVHFGLYNEDMKAAFEEANLRARLMEHKALEDRGFADGMDDEAFASEGAVPR